jgi:hypothetical protein
MDPRRALDRMGRPRPEEMDNDEKEGFCDSDTGHGLADATNASPNVLFNFHNNN